MDIKRWCGYFLKKYTNQKSIRRFDSFSARKKLIVLKNISVLRITNTRSIQSVATGIKLFGIRNNTVGSKQEPNLGKQLSWVEHFVKGGNGIYVHYHLYERVRGSNPFFPTKIFLFQIFIVSLYLKWKKTIFLIKYIK